MKYYIVFFNEDHEIKKATLVEQYPKVKDIVYVLKMLEKTDLKDIENLSMDILTEEDYKQI